jgi:hypothetical protein
VPSPIEFLIYRAYAIYIAASLAPFYFDLVMDAIITYSYYTDEGARACQPASIFTTWSHSVSDNTCGLWHRHADNTRKRYFWLSLSFFLLGIVITCCFDFLTTIETAGDRKDKRRLTMLATKIALNIIHVRILYEAIGAYSARARSKIDKDRDGNSVARELTPRTPPMSWDQVKAAEGLFEALPQSMMQARRIGPALRYLAPKSRSIGERYIGNLRKYRSLARDWPAP